jgi:hypothetical protein
VVVWLNVDVLAWLDLTYVSVGGGVYTSASRGRSRVGGGVYNSVPVFECAITYHDYHPRCGVRVCILLLLSIIMMLPYPASGWVDGGQCRHHLGDGRQQLSFGI